MMKKIWTDPVWSKVISVAIIGLLTLSYTKFLSITENLTFKEAFEKILKIKIELVYILLTLAVYLIINYLYTKIFKKKKAYSSIKQQELRSWNKTTNSDTGILFRWKVHFDNDTPFISDLTAFCTKHGETPIRFISNRCPFNDCINSHNRIVEYTVENIIESELINKWEKMK